MAQNLASKYSSKVDEVFRLTSKTDPAMNQDYDWDGVSSINIYGVNTVSMTNYTRSGGSRYGSPDELGTTKTAYTLSRDRSFTFTVDRRNRDESLKVTEAGKALRRQIDVVITPEIDIYRLAALNTAVTSNSAHVNTGATSSSNAYTNFLAVNERISNLSVPMTERIAFMTYAYYNFLKQGNFVVDSEEAYKNRKSGKYGTVDGVEIVLLPTSYMVSGVDLIVTHPVAMTSPMVLTDYIIHENAPGINGWLVEGRVVYDAFVLTNKINAIAGHKAA